MRKFECHITVDRPDSAEQLQLLKDFGEMVGWKTSYIQGDPLMGSKTFFYFTKYNEDATLLRRDMRSLTAVLALELDVPVLREKIEEIIYDTKTNHDVMEKSDE